MKKLLFITITALTLTSCQRGCTKLNKSFQTSERNYSITMFSGGDTVFVDSFRGIINNSESSDGVYYYNSKDELVEVSGDYVIKSN